LVVDVHTHVCPPRLPAPRGAHALWPDIAVSGPRESVITINGQVFRTIDARSWDGARRLHDMDEEGVSGQVLSPMPELLSYWLPVEDAAQLADAVNAQVLETAVSNPARFAALGMVTAQAPDLAVRQLETLAAAGFSGIEIGSHIDGRPLGHPDLWIIYEAAAALDLAVFVHPLHPCGGERVGGGGAFCAAALFPSEIALAAISLIRGGVFERFPTLRVLLSHGGGALQTILPRLSMAWRASEEIRRDLAHDPENYARRFWYDSNVYGEDALRALAARVGAARVAVGSDYPYLIRQACPGRFLEAALPGAGAGSATAASQWLHGDGRKGRMFS